MNLIDKIFCNKYIYDKGGYTIADRVEELQDQLDRTVMYPKDYIVISENRTNDTIESIENGTIVFNSGLLTNCTIVGNNTRLIFNTAKKIFENVTFEGTFICDYLMPESFGAKGDGITDDSNAILKCIDAAWQSNIHNVRLASKTYFVENTIYVKKNVTIEGNTDTNRYNYKDSATTILANISDGWVFDSDLYLATDHSARIPADIKVGKNQKFHSPYKEEAFNEQTGEPIGNDVYGGPYSIRKLAIISTYANDYDSDYNTATTPSFGAIRAIGITKSSYEDIIIRGFVIGMYLTQGWTTVVTRAIIEPILFGLITGVEVTGMICNNIQVVFRKIPTNIYGNLFDTFVRESYELGTYYNRYFGDDICKSTAYVFDSSNIILNLCSSEDAQLCCYALASNITFNDPYFEYKVGTAGRESIKDMYGKTIFRYKKSLWDVYKKSCIVFSISSNVFIDKLWGSLTKAPANALNFGILPETFRARYTGEFENITNRISGDLKLNEYYYPEATFAIGDTLKTTPVFINVPILGMNHPFILRGKIELHGDYNTDFVKRLGIQVTNCNFNVNIENI